MPEAPNPIPVEPRLVMIRSPLGKNRKIEIDVADEKNWYTVLSLLKLMTSLGVLDLDASDFDIVDVDSKKIDFLLKKYDKAVTNYLKTPKEDRCTSSVFAKWNAPSCSYKIAKEIVNMATNYAVPNPEKLNTHYEPHSSNTYGEINLHQMRSICDELNIGKDDVFVDLGSGIGKLVCFVSAYSQCKKAVGIELEKVPADFAFEIEKSQKCLMKFFGKEGGYFQLLHDDFLNEKLKSLITKEATVILINNYVFDTDLTRGIRSLFDSLQTGVRVVTTKSLEPKRKETGILRTEPLWFDACAIHTKLISLKRNVSWTSRTVQIHCATMDVTQGVEVLTEFNTRLTRTRKTSPNGSESSIENHETMGSSSTTENTKSKKRDCREGNQPQAKKMKK